MADKTYTEHIQVLQQWLRDTANTMVRNPDQRTWCLFDLNSKENCKDGCQSLTSKTFNDYFSTEDVNKQFADEVKKLEQKQITNLPVAQLQMENDHIFGINKMMVYRHQPRLKFYRDDMENKDIRTSSSISISLAKMQFLKELMQNSKGS